MLFKVTGADSHTGEERSVTVIASDESDAMAKAQKQGIFASDAAPVSERVRDNEELVNNAGLMGDAAPPKIGRAPATSKSVGKTVANRRFEIGTWIAAVHFAISVVILFEMFSAAMSPIPPEIPIWVEWGMWIILFPANIFALFGAFTNLFVVIIIVPLNSLLWAWCGAHLFVRDPK